MDESRTESLSLDQAATHLLEECRMVLPGIQALFGFQLIAVFNAGFYERLTAGEQRLHLVAILCVVAAVALVMAPAAIHRQTQPQSVSESFLRVSSRLLMWSMTPLAVGTALDVYLVSRLILGQPGIAAAVALLTLGLFAALWRRSPRMSPERDGLRVRNPSSSARVERRNDGRRRREHARLRAATQPCLFDVAERSLFVPTQRSRQGKQSRDRVASAIRVA